MEEVKLIKYSEAVKDLGKTQHISTVIAPAKNLDFWEMRIEFRRGSKVDSHLDKIYETFYFPDEREAQKAEVYFWDDPKVIKDEDVEEDVGIVLSYEDLISSEEQQEDIDE